ncbi:MAG: BamA/TamA family outer membrane protein [Longimicrobiales bacterium]
MHRHRSETTPLTALALFLLLVPTPGPGMEGGTEGFGSVPVRGAGEAGEIRQVSDTIPPDTYSDEATRALIQRAMVARSREEGGIQSYEGVLRERIYLGVSGLTFRRERSIFRSEQVARIRWDREEGKTIQWLGERNEVPLIGPGGYVSIRRSGDTLAGGSINLGIRGEEEEVPEEVRVEVQKTLLANLNPMLFSYRPGDDRLALGEGFALHPLADSAAYHYRYRPGDTLRIDLPTENRTITLLEVLVEPREARFELLAGSLWFEEETAALARASYRPSRPYDLAADDEEDVPGILSPVQVEFDYFTIEYSLQEFRWWLPRRFALRGEVRVGKLIRLPMAMEWSGSEYMVNAGTTLIPSAEALPDGWVSGTGEVTERGKPPEQVRIIVPPVDSLWSSESLTGEMLGPSPIAFTDEEIDELLQELDGLIPGQRPFEPRLSYGLADGNLRQNRVEGLSVGVSAEIPLSPRFTLEPRFQIGLQELEPRGALSLHRGPEGDRLSLTAFRRLAHTADFGNPLSLGASLSNLLFRNAHANFYQATGAELGLQKLGARTRSRLRLFWEDHRSVERQTNFYLWRPFTGDTLPLNLPAQEGRVAGLAGDFRWQLGVDPARAVASGLLRGEVAEGDFSFRRALATLAVSGPLVLGLAGAVEVGAGAGWGELPPQKNFFLGGANTLRGYAGSYTWGESFWMARGEIGTGLPVARLALFSDLGWAGSRDAWREGKPLWSVGGGISLLDGLFRMDFAWPMREVSAMRFYTYVDGLF